MKYGSLSIETVKQNKWKTHVQLKMAYMIINDSRQNDHWANFQYSVTNRSRMILYDTGLDEPQSSC